MRFRDIVGEALRVLARQRRALGWRERIRQRDAAVEAIYTHTIIPGLPGHRIVDVTGTVSDDGLHGNLEYTYVQAFGAGEPFTTDDVGPNGLRN